MADVTAPPPETDTPSPLEALQQKHRKEQRDLISRTTQKKKQASKKTRKGVNDECERLERELRDRQAEELLELTGAGPGAAADDEVQEDSADEGEEATQGNGAVDVEISRLSINGRADGSASPPPAAREPTSSSTAGAPGKKKNRQKERLARRRAEQDAAVAQAEEEARAAPDPRALEQQRFEPLLAARNLALHPIRADGHCLYAAVADQLATRRLSLEPRVPLSPLPEGHGAPPYKKTRYAAAGWIEAHREDFEPFMEDGLGEHVRRIRETGEWGGHLELMALARGYGVSICVLHGDGRVDRIEPEAEGGEGKGEGEAEAEIWLGYYRHSHGLGEHYNSLRKVEAA
jgi:OTU domain-containing protein 6